MLLLKEINEDLQFIKESKEGKPAQYYIRGPFLQGEIKNRNGRIYPMDVLSREVTRYTENFINKHRSFGELNHPTTPTINLDKVSHIITELKADGNNFIGRAKVLNETPNGKIVQALMDEKCVLGVSSRGLGALVEKNGAKMVSDFYLTTAGDIVADPSAPDAFVENIVENIEWIFNGADWVRHEKAVQIVEEYKQQKRAEREEQFLQMFRKLLNT